MRFLIYTASLLSVGLFSACSSSGSVEGTSGDQPELCSEAPIETYQVQLLDLAFSGVSEMPLQPHIKNRSRAQLKIVDTCLELDQPLLASGYIEKIENWQRWLGYANLAVWYAEQSRFDASRKTVAKVLPALRMSEDIRSGNVVASVGTPLIDTLQDGRYETVLTRIEEVRCLNGSRESTLVNEDVYGEVNAASLNVNRVTDDKTKASEAIEVLRPFTTHPNFEVAYQGLLQLAEVASEYYSDIDLQQLVKEEVDPRLVKVPVFLRINVYMEFAEVAGQHEDDSTAQILLEPLENMVAELQPRPRYYIPEVAKVIRLRNTLGQTDLVQGAVDDVLAYYKENQALVIDIDRAGLICHMAELYQLIGKESEALELYNQAITEGLVNPNSRPRADDLNRVCCSMALSNVEPASETWSRLNEMRSELGAPW